MGDYNIFEDIVEPGFQDTDEECVDDELDCWFNDIYGEPENTPNRINLSNSEIKIWIKQMKTENKLFKLFDEIGEDDIQNYLRLKKISRIKNNIK